ncbi:hypothetical protein B484DRAFT_395968, partial [Ochromonadaceae sp. CCMP2298]
RVQGCEVLQPEASYVTVAAGVFAFMRLYTSMQEILTHIIQIHPPTEGGLRVRAGGMGGGGGMGTGMGGSTGVGGGGGMGMGGSTGVGGGIGAVSLPLLLEVLLLLAHNLQRFQKSADSNLTGLRPLAAGLSVLWEVLLLRLLSLRHGVGVGVGVGAGTAAVDEVLGVLVSDVYTSPARAALLRHRHALLPVRHKPDKIKGSGSSGNSSGSSGVAVGAVTV